MQLIEQPSDGTGPVHYIVGIQKSHTAPFSPQKQHSSSSIESCSAANIRSPTSATSQDTATHSLAAASQLVTSLCTKLPPSFSAFPTSTRVSGHRGLQPFAVSPKGSSASHSPTQTPCCTCSGFRRTHREPLSCGDADAAPPHRHRECRCAIPHPKRSVHCEPPGDSHSSTGPLLSGSDVSAVGSPCLHMPPGHLGQEPHVPGSLEEGLCVEHAVQEVTSVEDASSAFNSPVFSTPHAESAGSSHTNPTASSVCTASVSPRNAVWLNNSNCRMLGEGAPGESQSPLGHRPQKHGLSRSDTKQSYAGVW